MRGPWLGSSRGYLTDWVTQRWVQATGRRVDLAETPWLDGPAGDTAGIGKDFYASLAADQRLEMSESPRAKGIMDSFGALAGPGFDPAAVHPAIRDFYENTAGYRLDVWSEWCGAFRPFGWLLAVLFSRRLQQLNIPLSALDTSRGLASRIVHLREPQSGEICHVGWIREIPDKRQVIYVGDYSTCSAPGSPGTCAKVVFPLPNGSATVILRPESRPDGSLLLHSHGERFGDPGFYFIVRRGGRSAWARYVRTMREELHVYVDASGELHTDHRFQIWGLQYLHLHYRMLPKAGLPPDL